MAQGPVHHMRTTVELEAGAGLHRVPVQGVAFGPTAAILPLAGAGVQIVALAASAVELRRLLDAGMDLLSDTRRCPAS